MPGPFPMSQRDNISWNGLPYFNLPGSGDTGQYAGYGNYLHSGAAIDTTSMIVDEFLCIPDKYVIPTNIMYYSQVHQNVISVLKRVRDFFRHNETYIGNETDPVKIEADKENFFCDMDVGLANDFFNAYSQWLSCKSQADGVDFTIYDKQQNFSFWQPYYPNKMSQMQYDYNTGGSSWSGGFPSNKIFNFRRPLTIYPISRYAKMGRNFPSNENYIRVYTRYSPKIISSIEGENKNMRVDFVGIFTCMMQHPHCQVVDDTDFMNLCEEYDIALVPLAFYGTTSKTLGFINFKNTGGRNMTHGVDYTINTTNLNNNFRTCFRICFGCNWGFDPASSTNPFSNAVNRDQSVITNPEFTAAEFWGKEVTTIDDSKVNNGLGYEEPAYSNLNIFSPRIQDYINYVFIGATEPKLIFQNSRMSFTDLYTPREYNAWDSEGNADPNIGSKIAFFNDATMWFSALNTTIACIPDTDIGGGGTGPATANGNLPAINIQGYYQHIRNTGISDELSGIGISNMYVRDEFATGFLPHQEGVYECKINLLGETENWDNSLFSQFGFELRQFKPLYGRSYNRYSQHNYGKTNELRYLGLNYFALNSMVNQSNAQIINVFGPNFLSNVLDPAPTAPTYDYPPPVRALPETALSYCGFQPCNVQVASDELRSANLPQKLQQSFYKVLTSLPTGNYICDNNSLSCAGYFYRNLKNSNYYFVYSQGSTFTTTDDTLLTTIRTRITNEKNRPAEHLGNSCISFYRITIPAVLTQLDQDDINTFVKASETKKGLEVLAPLSKVQKAQLNSINLGGSIVNMVGVELNPIDPLGTEGLINIEGIGVNPEIFRDEYNLPDIDSGEEADAEFAEPVQKAKGMPIEPMALLPRRPREYVEGHLRGKATPADFPEQKEEEAAAADPEAEATGTSNN